ncbi:hypothetical protein [Mycobacterium sherrisii]|uniref:Diacylglycerol O-acyltransferase n=1 Tax=Mycobacterium sherrisii TaxID=243061 RepID=A0A1E3T0Q5_9MYCO|nr:hypothetical protein [Mycobacterium sherrisii]MCV7028225.1 hypothetical protein [Mycobacterium sherrisii]MEC4765396.1 hypothetical protein [Mycobacterium sherrisii]ODR07930.1 hypothetical protein BHQ21_07620 [Mycobacterium sherrisii]ORW77831.1 hypothetical protein AWC25_07530 [Mycobacterium sherrisii]
MARLALLDQAAFLRLRANGQGSAVQCTWVYDRDVDLTELRRFNDHLGAGLLGRRIERARVPFGRHRWVVDHRSPGIVIDARRPRSQVATWIEARGCIPVDPEHGPTFHLGVLPLDDGGAAVTLVTSHCIVDGLGLATAITDAVNGKGRNLGYPQPNSRPRWRAVAEDLVDVLATLPAAARALIATLRITIEANADRRPRVHPPPTPVDDEPTALPAVIVHTDAAAWEARARELNGSGNSLFVAYMAALAQQSGRMHTDGKAVTVVLPVSDRGIDDDRANALTSIALTVDRRRVDEDLSAVRADIRNRLTSLGTEPNEMLAGLPLVPFTPRWLARRAESIAMATDQLPVGCSNMGRFDAALARIDGDAATDVSIRLVEPGLTRGRIEQVGGQLFGATGIVNGNRFIAVALYQCGADNSAVAVRELVCRTLAGLALHATAVYGGESRR